MPMTHGITAVQQKLTPAPLSVEGNETSQTPSMTDNDNQSIPRKETQMQNRLKQLPLNVQKHVYEIAGMAGTNCPDWGSTNERSDA